MKKEDFKKRAWNIFVTTARSPSEAREKYKENSICTHPPTTDEPYILNFIRHDEVERLLDVLYEDVTPQLNNQ